MWGPAQPYSDSALSPKPRPFRAVFRGSALPFPAVRVEVRGRSMAAGGSDPRAGDVEEDASQLIFPKGAAWGFPTIPVVRCGWRRPSWGWRARRRAGRRGMQASGERYGESRPA